MTKQGAVPHSSQMMLVPFNGMEEAPHATIRCVVPCFLISGFDFPGRLSTTGSRKGFWAPGGWFLFREIPRKIQDFLISRPVN
jgi:hypothetical protein